MDSVYLLNSNITVVVIVGHFKSTDTQYLAHNLFIFCTLFGKRSPDFILDHVYKVITSTSMGSSSPTKEKKAQRHDLSDPQDIFLLMTDIQIGSPVSDIQFLRT